MAFRYPLNNFKISQGFGGNAAYYKQFGQKGHNGIDLAANSGEPVYAADEGAISFEGWGQNHSWLGVPAGICVLIHHGGSYGNYAHLSRTVVSKGQKVKKGQLIGYVGATGAATGPHLHFEMPPLKPNFNNGYAGRMDVTPYIKATIKLATEAEIKKAYTDILERPADAKGIAHYKKYTLEFVRADLNKSPEKRKLDAKKAADKLATEKAKAEAAKKAEDRRKAEMAAKKAQEDLDRIEAEETAASLAVEQRAQAYRAIQENNALLKRILDLLAKIFNIGSK